MEKVAVIFWSGTGNTEAMAQAVAKGVVDAGGESVCVTSADFDVASVSEYSGFAFGCPSMGAEQLEDGEFEPMWDSVKTNLEGKKVVLFGSYGWGDGEWMRTWKDESPVSILDTFICNEFPDNDAVEACQKLGEALV